MIVNHRWMLSDTDAEEEGSSRFHERKPRDLVVAHLDRPAKRGISMNWEKKNLEGGGSRSVRRESGTEGRGDGGSFGKGDYVSNFSGIRIRRGDDGEFRDPYCPP